MIKNKTQTASSHLALAAVLGMAFVASPAFANTAAEAEAAQQPAGGAAVVDDVHNRQTDGTGNIIVSDTKPVVTDGQGGAH